MFFDSERISLSLVEVGGYDLRSTRTTHEGRGISALSFRTHADATLISRDGERQVGDGVVTFIPARTRYTRISRGDELIAIHFHTEESFRSIECFLPSDPSAFAALFREILRIWQERRPGYLHRATALTYELLARIREQGAGEERVEQELPVRLEAALRLLRRRYTDPCLRISELARESFVSEAYFRRLFLNALGVPPRRYLISMRLERARRLLETEQYAVKEVAQLSGFADSKHFATEFRRMYGMTPTAYRDGERGSMQ